MNSLDFVKYTLQPAVTQYEEEDSRKLLTISERKRGLWLQRNMMAELRGDTASRKEWVPGHAGGRCVQRQRHLGLGGYAPGTWRR